MSNIVELPDKEQEIIDIATSRNLKIIKDLKKNLLVFICEYRGRRERFHPFVYPFYLIMLAKVHNINKAMKESGVK